MFELYYLPLHLDMGIDQAELPGLSINLPPRRAHRSRAQDILLTLVTPFGGTHPASRVLENMQEEAAGVYYGSRGSVTSALRSAAEHFNHLFLKYNAQLQGNRKDGQIFGYLNLAVLRGDILFILHVGATSSFLLRPDELQHFQADSARGRGLGISRSAPLSFFQAQVQPDSILLFCANPAQVWSEETLSRGPRLTLSLLRRRLVNTSQGELRAAVVQFKTASQPAVHRLRPKSEPPQALLHDVPLQPLEDHAAAETEAVLPLVRLGEEVFPEVLVEQTAPGSIETGDEQEDISSLLDSILPGEEAAPDDSAAADEMIPEWDEAALLPAVFEPLEPLTDEKPAFDESSPAETSLDQQPKPAVEVTTPPRRRLRSEVPVERPPEPRSEAVPAGQKKREKKEDPWLALQKAQRKQIQRKKLAMTFQKWNETWQKITQGIKNSFVRLLPGVSEQSPHASGGNLLIISLIVPLLVVAVAATIYMNNGRTQQHQTYLQQALIFAKSAREELDPSLQRSNWTQSLHWLDLAEEYLESDESIFLRKQANQALDSLDGIERLDFQPLTAFGFSSTLNFEKIVANETEVYLLETSQGRILRLFLTGQGYELDNEFSCGPGTSGSRVVGELVDMITLPPGNSKNAVVMALDKSGNILYCTSDDKAPFVTELIAPLEGWGEISSIAYYQGTLYVLDALYGAVYTYRGYNMEFSENPNSFFNEELDENIPDMRTVIDIAAYGEDLYLLNEKGYIAHCVSGIYEDYQTICDDPAAFGDMRLGREGFTLVFPSAYFTQVYASLPPDPSLFLLDVNAPAVYQFSLQLNLGRLIQPSVYSAQMPDPPASAFAVSPARILYLAYGNRVFYASLIQ